MTIIAAIGLAAGAYAQESSAGRLNLFVSILPQAYFVERIAGEYADVSVLVGPGQSPATYEPTPKQLAQLSEADVYFTIGVPFERHLLDKLSAMFDNLNIVRGQEGIVDQATPESSHHDQPHSEHGHDHGDIDPHTWLDPGYVSQIAKRICDGIIDIDPEHRRDYESNLNSFRADLDSADARIRAQLAPFKGERFYVFHPAFGHFAKAYGLQQVSIEHMGKEPSIRQLAEVIEQAKIDSVKVIVVQEQFSTRQAESIAEEVGAEVVNLDPLSRDYLRNLERIAEVLSEGMRRE